MPSSSVTVRVTVAAPEVFAVKLTTTSPLVEPTEGSEVIDTVPLVASTLEEAYPPGTFILNVKSADSPIIRFGLVEDSGAVRLGGLASDDPLSSSLQETSRVKASITLEVNVSIDLKFIFVRIVFKSFE
jgi:hypothetical protein